MKLGDLLERIFKYTGVKWIVKKIHPDCNCEQRRDDLNNLKFKRR